MADVLSSLVALALPALYSVAVLVVAGLAAPLAGAGRRLLWLGAGLLAANNLLSSVLFTLVIPQLIRSGPLIRFQAVSMATSVVTTLIGLTGVGLLIRGIVAAARGASAQPPYPASYQPPTYPPSDGPH